LYQRKISNKAIIQNEFLNLMAAISFINQNIHFPAANEFIGLKYQSKNRNQINHRAYMLNVHWPNQRLNLTEPAVDDLTRAKQIVTVGLDIPRADGQPCRRYFRRRLSAVRYASLAAGEDCIKENE
jgi:hypothetical protein